ncbi:hypothetical protein P154DRAFT_517816 [Amniculicola lignicola CBS 123094]|uniref:C2H2-type domain-containing protein n=1 Tax=Amniculicola lignicola CBS 123094 TaxID=1392246 RepID=A0A6A5WZ89_9PLEO|nr:hypothetical protein P154DRAFT_517816 [Amniculicola lignicola CBS 123094]
MEAVTWTDMQYKQTSLLRHRHDEEPARRDSMNSERTHDSGYTSDPDWDLRLVPPLTFEFSHVGIDSPTSSNNAKLSKNPFASILEKNRVDGQKGAQLKRAKVTSCPKQVFELEGKWGNTIEISHDTLRKKSFPTVDVDMWTWTDETFPSHNRPKERVSSIVSLTSTSSVGNYSITDDSEEDEMDERSAMLPKATMKTIELIMRKIEVNLGYVAYIQAAGAQSSKEQNSSGSTARGGRRASTQGTVGKRKSRGEGDSPSENPDDNGSNKRRRVSITTTEDSEIGPRFACPFYKHDPNRYRSRRTCPGPGWPTVHRMKEHLYRAHAQPIFCPRCYTMFDADSDLSMHLRAHPCQISTAQPIEGIDRETLKSLRKRSPALRLEEDKWRDTYQLLFPSVPPEDIPSPYYNSDSPSEESRRFRRDLLERIRSELHATAEREPGPVEQRLLRQVASIIQRCETDLLNAFHQQHQHQQLDPTAPQRSTTGPPTAESSSSTISIRGGQSGNDQPPFHPTSQPPRHNQIPGFCPASTVATAPSASNQATFHVPSIPALPSRLTKEAVDEYTPMPMTTTGHIPSVPSLDTETVPNTVIGPVVPDDTRHYSPWDSSEFIDWNVVFPPGDAEGEGERSEMQVGPVLVAPVWT